MRSEFEVYRKEVEVETMSGTKKYSLLPLSGRYMPKLMSVVAKMQESSKEGSDGMLDEDTTAKLHTLIKETLRVSLNVEEKDLEQLDFFVSQNLFKFMEALVEVNFGDDKKSN